MLFSELVMTGCEMPPGGLSQESGSSGVELFELSSPFRHSRHTLTTKCVIDVQLKVKAGVFLLDKPTAPTLSHT